MDSLQNWFLIVQDQFPSPCENMAIDEYLMIKAEENENTTYLRFYGWNPPAVSIGRSQKANRVVNHELLRKNKIGFVRRPTGGKAVLHYEELTYSIASSDKRFISSPSVRAVYNQLAKALLKGLLNLKIEAEIVSKDPKGLVRTNLPCFSYPTRDEIEVKGKKIIGSAQKRSKNAILQHGSIPIKDHRELYAELTSVDKDLLLSSMTTIENETGESNWDKIAEAFIEGFKEEFNINYEGYEFSKKDKKEINNLIHKYSDNSWNFEL